MYRLSAFPLVVLAALLVAGLPGAAHAAPAAGFHIAVAGTPLAVRTDGTYVAWAEDVQPTRFTRYANLYVADLASGQVRLQLGQLSYSSYMGRFGAGFALGDGILVWRDGALGAASPLVARDLRTGTGWVVAENGGLFPDVFADTAVWWEIAPVGGAPTTAVLKTRRLAPDAGPPTEVIRLPLAHDYDLRDARASGGWAAWVQSGSPDGTPAACPVLSVVSLGGGAPQPIADGACHDDQRIPFDLSGDRLAYVDRNNLLVEREPPLIERRRSGPHANLDITLADRWLFWNHAAAPGPWGYDPVSASRFQAGNSAVRASIAAGGGVLAWFESAPSGGYTLQARPIASLLPDAPRDPADPAIAGRAFFPETGHSLGGEFAAFWGRNGGLPVFGFALTEEFLQRSADTGADYTVQFFERQRFEYHPENGGTPYIVELGRLGAEALAAQGRDWQALPKASPSTPHYFAATGQAIAPEFWEYWRTHGLELGDAGVSEREALALWGYPLTPPAYEPLPNGETLLVQWFERARFEYHPNNPAPYRVLLGRLAADRVAGFGWR